MVQETMHDRWKGRQGEFHTAMLKKQGDYVNMVSDLDKFYHGDHSPMMGVSGYLSKMFPQAYAGGKLALSALPLTKRIVDAQATLFHRRPGWILKQNGEDLPPDNPQVMMFEALRKETHLDLTCRKIQRRDRLWNTVFAKPSWRLEKIQIDVIKPSVVGVIESKIDPSDLDDAEAIAIEINSGIYEIWEKPSIDNGWLWTYGVVNFNDGSEYDPLFGGTFINGYSEYPLVRFSHNPSTGIYGVVDDALLNAQIGVDVLESWADFQFRLGFTIAVLTTTKDLGKTDMPISPDMVVKLTPGQEESFERIASGLDTGQLTSYIEDKIKRFAALSSIDPDILSSDSKQFMAALSGIAQQYDRMDLQELREESEVPYEEALPALIDKSVTVNNWHRTDSQISEDLEVCLRWYMPKPPQNRLQESQADKMDIEEGIRTRQEVRADRAGKPESEMSDADVVDAV